MKELEDYSWFPVSLRNFQTELIGFVVSKFNVYGSFINYLKTLSLPQQTMTDLCSGSGEPAISIFKKSNCFTHLILSDKYPNTLQLSDDKISYKTTNADVLEMEFKLGTYYTMFNALHHFKDDDKLKIINKIRASNSDAFFAEILEPRVDCFLKVFLTTTLGTILFTPFIRPFSLKRLLLTYILPLNILTITFDGLLSVLKSRSVRQYQKLFAAYTDEIKVLRLTNGLAPLIVIQIQSKK
ncbi:MAG: class I SAM-dependent methyltransferase [Bacteroidia bacterium]